MKCNQRLKELEKATMLSPIEVQDRLEAFKAAFVLMYDRQPTAEEIEEERVSLLNPKPVNLSDTITEIEKMVYEGRNK